MNDDELDPHPVPDPDAEPTAAEKSRARAFSDLVDKVVAGRPPAAMSAEDRALVEVATVIRASQGLVELPEQRKASLIEDALRRAVDGPRGRETEPPASQPAGGGAHHDELAQRRARAPRAPWIVAGLASVVAAAAVLMMVVRAPRTTPAPAEPAPVATPEHHRSRPADALVGVIPQERAGDAAARIDAIFADRLDGYRELAFGGQP